MQPMVAVTLKKVSGRILLKHNLLCYCNLYLLIQKVARVRAGHKFITRSQCAYIKIL
jgi:hypothetical protein